jgi:hypothetical protein
MHYMETQKTGSLLAVQYELPDRPHASPVQAPLKVLGCFWLVPCGKDAASRFTSGKPCRKLDELAAAHVTRVAGTGVVIGS